MILDFILQVLSLSAAYIGVFGKTSKTKRGKDVVTIFGWSIVAIATCTLIFQLIVSRENEKAAEKRSAEIANLLNNSGSLIDQTKKLEDSLTVAMVHVISARNKAQVLSLEIDAALEKNSAYLKQSIGSAIDETHKDLGKMVEGSKEILNESISKTTKDLGEKINNIASEKEIERIFNGAIEKRLGTVNTEIDKLLKELNSLEAKIEKQNSSFFKSDDKNWENSERQISALQSSLTKSMDNQERYLSNLGREISSLERQVQSLGRSR